MPGGQTREKRRLSLNKCVREREREGEGRKGSKRRHF